MIRNVMGLNVLLFAVATCGGQARGSQILVNGGFESGLLAGWNIATQDLGGKYDPGDSIPATARFVIQDSSGVTPISGVSGVPGPAEGVYYALSDMNAVSAVALYQGFVVPVGTTHLQLSFDMYAYNLAGDGGAIDLSAGLSPLSTTVANQHARVDLLTGSASHFATDAGSVLQNFYQGVDPEGQNGNTDAPLFRHYSFDLTSLALPGGTYQLRFAVVDNEFPLYQGVDNVTLDATSTSPVAAVPEPSTWLLAASGLAVLGLYRSVHRS